VRWAIVELSGANCHPHCLRAFGRGWGAAGRASRERRHRHRPAPEPRRASAAAAATMSGAGLEPPPVAPAAGEPVVPAAAAIVPEADAGPLEESAVGGGPDAAGEDISGPVPEADPDPTRIRRPRPGRRRCPGWPAAIADGDPTETGREGRRAASARTAGSPHGRSPGGEAHDPNHREIVSATA
jgi:hypothetical protein